MGGLEQKMRWKTGEMEGKKERKMSRWTGKERKRDQEGAAARKLGLKFY